MNSRLFEDGTRHGVAITGRFGFADYSSFKNLLSRMIASGTDWVIDLGAMDFIDSAGLGMLLVATEEFRRSGHTLILRHPRGQVRRTLEITTMRDLFTIEEAIETLSA
jgi:anti-anti-sigma factor